MNEKRTETPAATDASFARVALLRAAQVNPAVLTAAQARFEADNHHDISHHNHHNHHGRDDRRG